MPVSKELLRLVNKFTYQVPFNTLVQSSTTTLSQNTYAKIMRNTKVRLKKKNQVEERDSPKFLITFKISLLKRKISSNPLMKFLLSFSLMAKHKTPHIS